MANIYQKKVSRKELRRFGLLLAVVFAAAGLNFFRHGQTEMCSFWIAFLLLSSSLFFPVVLNPVYALWKALAFILGWGAMRIVLLLIFYLVMTPIGLLGRIFKHAFLDLDFRRKKDSYWEHRENLPFKKEDYGRLF